MRGVWSDILFTQLNMQSMPFIISSTKPRNGLANNCCPVSLKMDVDCNIAKYTVFSVKSLILTFY